jgi:hypothetical protein
MLVTLHSKAWSSITMFGDVAVTLLKMAGHSGTIPGAMPAADIPSAVARLNQALAATPEEESAPSVPSSAEDTDEPEPVGLRLRAYPLIQLLSAAAKQDCDVMWNEGAPLI